ncbi:Fe(2+) transporter permease subunit FeoB [Neisseriaceae bacterium PsAf]|nr:Fe(2+) transporter permease subunit FeoB [Neisseriaceae bacterium PsAf]
MTQRIITLISNPNSGKTTVFNALTGSHQRVGNWPGVTVDKKTGNYSSGTQDYLVVDLPGTYTIQANQEGVSEDELIARNFVLTDKESVLINIVDAYNLQRNLFLTFQLLELNRPMIVVLNMMDVAQAQGMKIDVSALEKALGCPVIPVSANRGKGIPELKKIIDEYFDNNTPVQIHIDTISPEVKTVIDSYLKQLDESSPILQLSDLAILETLSENIEKTTYSNTEKQILLQCQQTLSDLAGGAGADIAIIGSRYEIIDRLGKEVITEAGVASSELTEKLDKVALGKWTGIPFFLLVMFLMFQFAINIGTSFNDFFEITFGAIFVDGLRIVLENINTPEWLITILADGIGDGIKTTASFIPVIFFMFFFLSFLEDSGYLARAAMVIDRGMQRIGLPGKAFVPMVVGFGCNIPAIMGTRTLENSEDRLLSISMIPFMSCGARLPVYALFAAIFFPYNGGVVVYSLYLFGIVIAIFTGLLVKKTLLSNDLSPFVMELPLYHLPTLKGLLLSTWQRLKAFITKAGRAILIVVTVLSVLNSLGTDGSFGNANTDKSVLATSAKAITPVFEPMGLTEENWPATVGIITGVLAKEVVIGTLNSLYQQMSGTPIAEEEFSLKNSFQEAISVTTDNLKDLPQRLLDPLAISGKLADGDIETVKAEEEVSDQTVTKIRTLFPSTAAVMAYLIFILLYTPCVAALGAIYRESTLRWTIMIAIWTFAIAWICATAYYQFSLLGTDANQQALTYLISLPILLAIIYLFLLLFGKKLFIGSKTG